VETCALLYVEDEDSRASSGRRYVGRASPFVVYRVAEEEQAMALLNRSGICELARRPERIVLDLSMPRVDGWTALSKMQTTMIYRKFR
jgi:CheY-like chemotaxis protein